jgi:hypothetical protein
LKWLEANFVDSAGALEFCQFLGQIHKTIVCTPKFRGSRLPNENSAKYKALTNFAICQPKIKTLQSVHSLPCLEGGGMTAIILSI